MIARTAAALMPLCRRHLRCGSRLAQGRPVARRILAGFRHRVRPRTNAEPSSGRSVRWGILDVACIIRQFRSCLQHNRCGGNHPRLEGGELGVGHVAEPFGNRIGRKMQIQRLRWVSITAVQKRCRGGEACRIRVSVLRKFNQGVDRQTRILAGFDHQVANGPTICTVWIVRIRSEFQQYWRGFRQTRRIPALALLEPSPACSVTAHLI